jgi:ABC-2 type transport system permease protein
VNWEHFKAIVWLRWRLLYNQNRRAGVLNAVLTVIVFVAALLTAIPLFIGCLILGLYAIPKARPEYLMYAADAVVVAFLFFWMIGLITELQRTDPLSLSKFMHLPVSANGAFLINYFSSLLRLSLISFLPVMLAFALALLIVKGVSMLLVLPLLASFVLMVTAVTYQFQGWLALLMSNPRRRRTVIMIATLTFVLIVNLPNLLNFLAPWGRDRQMNSARDTAQELQQLSRDVQSGAVKANEFPRLQQEIVERQRNGAAQADREGLEKIERTVRFANMILPIGWLPLGVATAAEGSLIPSLLGLPAMSLIGSASLYRAYRTTIGMYQGVATSRKGRPAPALKAAAGPRKLRTSLLEAQLPGVSEPVAAVALAGFRSLLRAPEAKMMLISPVIMSVIFGSMLWKSRNAMSESFRPLIAIGGMAFVLFGVVQLMSNQFGFDRDGFRVFVLSSARRRDILMGKNLSFAPLVLGMATVVLGTLQAVAPLRWDHFLAMIPQSVSMFLLFCLLMNFLSIYAPVFIAAGSLKPANPKLLTVLLHLVTFMVLFPLTQAFTLIPLGVETAMQLLGYGSRVPICLLLTLVECALVAVIYYFCSAGLGNMLQSREQKILETVTAKAS